jgi:hypothetical protein
MIERTKKLSHATVPIRKKQKEEEKENKKKKEEEKKSRSSMETFNSLWWELGDIEQKENRLVLFFVDMFLKSSWQHA